MKFVQAGAASKDQLVTEVRIVGDLPYAGRMAVQKSQLLALNDLCKTVADRWLSVSGLPVESNACVFAARVLRVGC